MSDLSPSNHILTLIELIELSQKKGCYTLEQAAILFQCINVVKSNVHNNTVSEEVQHERDEAIALLGQYKNAIDNLKQSIHNQQSNIQVLEEKLKQKETIAMNQQIEIATLKKDLLDLISKDEDEDEDDGNEAVQVD